MIVCRVRDDFLQQLVLGGCVGPEIAAGDEIGTGNSLRDRVVLLSH